MTHIIARQPDRKFLATLDDAKFFSSDSARTGRRKVVPHEGIDNIVDNRVLLDPANFGRAETIAVRSSASFE
jgi:hypothetical protein